MVVVSQVTKLHQYGELGMAQLMHDLYVELQLTAPAVSADDEQKELNIHARTSKLYTQGLVNVETLSLHQSLKQVLQDMNLDY